MALDGFGTVLREGLSLDVGQVLTVDFSLPLAGVTQGAGLRLATLNRTKLGGINMTWGTTLAPRDTFGTFTSANTPRQIQLGPKSEF